MDKKALKQNLLFAAVILLLAVGMVGWRFWQRSQRPAMAVAAKLTYGDANTVMEISLDKSAVYDVDTGYYTVHIEVANGAVRFTNSPCPDHICENYGWISLEDQQAVCMPAHAVLMIVPVA